MTLSRWRKVIENPEGVGQVRRGEKVVAKVSYALSVELEEIIAKTFGGKPKARLGENKHITGRISISDGDIAIGEGAEDASDTLTLLMEDGREVDFYIVEHDQEISEHLIRGKGDFR